MTITWRKAKRELVQEYSENIQKQIYYWRSSSWCSNQLLYCEMMRTTGTIIAGYSLMPNNGWFNFIRSFKTHYNVPFVFSSFNSGTTAVNRATQYDALNSPYCHYQTLNRERQFQEPFTQYSFWKFESSEESASQSSWRGIHLTSKTETSTGNTLSST